MKIKTMLYSSIVASIIAFIATVAICLIAFHRIHMENVDAREATELIRDVFRANLILSEYMIYGEERPLAQWKTHSERISEHLMQMQFQKPENQALLDGIKKKHHAVISAFSDLASISAGSAIGNSMPTASISPVKSRLQSRILVKNHDIFNDMIHIVKASEKDLKSTQENALSFILAVVFFLSAAACGIAVFTAGSILKPLKRLQVGANRVARGDLDHLIHAGAKNEIGLLTDDFNRMVNDLKSIMISKGEMEQIVARRTKKLDKANIRLQKEITDRINTSQALAEQLAFEHLIAKLSSAFVHTPPGEIDQIIIGGLRLLGEYFEVDRCLIAQFQNESHRPGQIHLWHVDEIETDDVLSDVEFTTQFPWLTNQLLSNQIFLFNHIDDLAPEAVNERKYVIDMGIKSSVQLSLQAGGAVIGALFLESIREKKDWSDALIRQVTPAVDVISSALSGKNSFVQLQDAFSKIKELKDRVEQENVYLRQEIEIHHKHEDIIGKSEPVMEMLRRAEQVAETDSTVLILGETGTGKELLARAIHKLSSRKNHPMIEVNCAALPATLMESEMFGCERGAFTGAINRQIGRFEVADGSTLLLDEIGDLPLELQGKLLRVLQEGRFERLGSPKSIHVNVRIIASTNRDLAMEVKAGRFREDLYYRLNVFPITAPPLRDRLEDVPLLVWTFVKEFKKSMGKNIQKIPEKDMNALRAHSWPGNIRELKNVVENAMIICSNTTLHIYPPMRPADNKRKPTKLKDVERGHIKDVLKKTLWRVSGKNGAANLLGLKPTTLESRMKKLDIVRPKRR